MSGISANVFDAPWAANPPEKPTNWLDMALKQQELQKYSLENAQTIAQQRAFRDFGDAASRGDPTAIGRMGASGAWQQAGIASQIPSHLATGQGLQWGNQSRAMSQIQQNLRNISDPELQKSAAQGYIAEAQRIGVISPQMAYQYHQMVNDPRSLNAFIYQDMEAARYTAAQGMDKLAQDRAAQEGKRFDKSMEPPILIPGEDRKGNRFSVPTAPTELPYAQPPVQPNPGGGFAPLGPRAPTAPTEPAPGPRSEAEPPPGPRTLRASFDTQEGVLPKGAYSARLDPSEGYGQNPMSSAYGRGQFIKSTWLNMLAKTHPEYNDLSEQQRLGLRGNTALATEMTEAYAKENAVLLEKAGLPVNAATLAMAHKLGPGGAIRTLQADPNTSMTEILGADAARRNPTWARQSAQGFINSTYNAMTGMRPEFLGPPTPTKAAPVEPTETGPNLSNKGPNAPPAGPATPSAAQAVRRQPLEEMPGSPGAVATGRETSAGTAAPGTPQYVEPPAAARSTAPFKLAAVVGDSLGQQVNNHAKVEGIVRVGAPSEEIERRIQSLPDGYFRGRDVLLSSGTSNSSSDPEKFDRTERMIDDIQGRLQGRVALLGVGQRYKDFNNKLQQIAEEHNVPFIAPTGPFTKHDGGVHMQNAAATHQNVIDTATQFYSGPPAQPQAPSVQNVDTLGRPQVTPIPAPPPLSGPAIITEPPAASGSTSAPTGPPDTVVAPGTVSMAANQPATTPDGPIRLMAPIPTLTEEQKNTMQSNTKMGETEYKSALDQAVGAEGGQAAIKRLEWALGVFRTGTTGEFRTAINQWGLELMTLMGVPVTDELRKAAAAGELIRVAGNTLAFDMVRALGAREAVQVVQQVMTIKPNLLLSPEGNRLIVAGLKQDFQRAIDRRNFMGNMSAEERHKGWADFNREHPVEQYSSRVVPEPLYSDTKPMNNVIYKMKDPDNGEVYAAKWDQGRKNGKGDWVDPGVKFSKTVLED